MTTEFLKSRKSALVAYTVRVNKHEKVLNLESDRSLMIPFRET